MTGHVVSVSIARFRAVVAAPGGCVIAPAAFLTVMVRNDAAV